MFFSFYTPPFFHFHFIILIIILQEFFNYFMYFYKFRQTLQNKGDKMSFALTLMEGGDYMTTPDLIWNLVSLLIDRIEQDSKKEKEKSNDKDD